MQEFERCAPHTMNGLRGVLLQGGESSLSQKATGSNRVRGLFQYRTKGRSEDRRGWATADPKFSDFLFVWRGSGDRWDFRRRRRVPHTRRSIRNRL